MQTAHLIQALFCPAVMLLVILFVVVYWVLTARRRRAQRARVTAIERINRGYCPTCNYDLAASLPSACPECGHPFTDAEMAHLHDLAPILMRARQDAASDR
jgi:hypothetical protein